MRPTRAFREHARLRARLVAGTMLLALGTTPALAQSPSGDIPFLGGTLLGSGQDRLSFGAGMFNVIPGHGGPDDTSAEGRFEYRLGGRWYGIGPMVGVMANSDGAVFGYVSGYADLAYGPWILTPTVGVGAYSDGSSKDLGGVFQFGLSFEVAYAFENDTRLGLRWAHISNAGLHDRNPGVDSVLVTLSVPLGF